MAHKFYAGMFWNYASQSMCFFAVQHVDRIPSCARSVRRIVAVSVKEARYVYNIIEGN